MKPLCYHLVDWKLQHGCLSRCQPSSSVIRVSPTRYDTLIEYAVLGARKAYRNTYENMLCVLTCGDGRGHVSPLATPRRLTSFNRVFAEHAHHAMPSPRRRITIKQIPAYASTIDSPARRPTITEAHSCACLSSTIIPPLAADL